MKTTVVLTPRLFERPTNGSEICTERLLRELEHAGHRLVIIGRGDAPPDSLLRRHVSIGPGVRAFDTLRLEQRVGLVLQALISPRALTVQRMSDTRTAHRARQSLAAEVAAGIHHLVVNHLQVLDWLRDFDGPLPAPLLVMHNLESQLHRELGRTAVSGMLARAKQRFREREARLLGDFERAAVKQAAAIACLSDADAKAMHTLSRQAGAAPRIEVLPAYPLQNALPVERAGNVKQPDSALRIGMIGTWTWGPNRLALEWMLGQVLPLLPSHCCLVIAGTGLELIKLPQRAIPLGAVAHSSDLYACIDVVAVPAVAGSGIQEKSVEALASGRPVVATAHALRGLHRPLPSHVFVADEPKTFARLCAEAKAGPADDDAVAVQAWSRASRRMYLEALSRWLESTHDSSIRRGLPADRQLNRQAPC